MLWPHEGIYLHFIATSAAQLPAHPAMMRALLFTLSFSIVESLSLTMQSFLCVRVFACTEAKNAVLTEERWVSAGGVLDVVAA